jgi:signal transduction histidine kinase
MEMGILTGGALRSMVGVRRAAVYNPGFPVMTREENQDNRLAFLGAIAGGLAHEIKNPLSTMALNVQLLLEDLDEPRNEKDRRARRKLEVLSREVKRLEGILDDFLRFAGEHKLEKEPVRLAEVVQELLDFLAPRLVAAGVSARVSFSEDLPVLSLDRNAMKQVFLNLFLNAIQAMPHGGELLVRTAREAGEALLEVTDTGEGIPPEMLERIWQVYWSRRRTGTGMGLPITRRYVEDHGGTISVLSELGKGTRFTIRLPVPEGGEGG